MSRSLAFALCCSGTLLAQRPFAVQATIENTDAIGRNAASPLQPFEANVALAHDAPKGFTAPRGVFDAWFGAHAFAGKNVVFGVGKSAPDAEQPDLLCVDLDCNDAIGEGERFAIRVTTREEARDWRVTSSEPVEVSITGAGATVTASAEYIQAGKHEPHLTLRFPRYLSASVTIAAERCTIGVVDTDLDGQFDGPSDAWVLAGPRAPRILPPAYSLTILAERRYFQGHLVGIKVLRPSAIEVTVTEAKGLDPNEAGANRQRVETYCARKWEENREEAYRGWAKLGLVDTGRPAATRPVAWNYVSFAEGLALARKANKPLFLELITWAIPGTYSYGYMTYSDQEIAAVLNDAFVPVRIIYEQDVAGDYDVLFPKLAKGRYSVPAVFAADGKMLHKFDGTPPIGRQDEFVEELATVVEESKKK
jgi:hypothetical protein